MGSTNLKAAASIAWGYFGCQNKRQNTSLVKWGGDLPRSLKPFEWLRGKVRAVGLFGYNLIACWSDLASGTAQGRYKAYLR